MAWANEGYISQLPPLDPALVLVSPTPEPFSSNALLPPEDHGHNSTPLVNGHRALSEDETTMECVKRWAFDLAYALWRIFLISFTIITVALFIVSSIAIIIAFCSASGALLVLIGNAVLRRAGHSGYAEDRIAAAVGAAGGLLATLCFGLLSFLFYQPSSSGLGIEQPPALVRISSSVIIGTLSGAIGSAILLSNKVDLGGLDVSHATRAGAVGGAIMTIAALVLIPLIFATLVCVMPMMLDFMIASVGWLQDRFDDDQDSFRPVQLPPDDLEGAASG